MKKDFIGVFDSGVGGLTVLNSISSLLPNENYYYVADQGHCPYGPKPQEYVGDRVEKICKHMENLGAKAIVIACNTASLQIERGRKVCSIPIISVIQPTVNKAIKLTKNKKVAILATSATIASKTYHKYLEEKDIKPIGLPCNEFVLFVESGNENKDDAQKVVDDKLKEIKDEGFDTLIHGCTHFSILEPQMRNVLGDINYVACGEPTGEELKKILSKKDLLRKSKRQGKIQIFTTGNVDSAIKSMKFFKKKHSKVKHIDIE